MKLMEKYMIEYLQNEEVKAMIEQGGTYQKSAKTGLRNPQISELGNTFNTYVLKDGALRVESTNTVTEDTVVARNPGVIGQMDGKDVYNEWLVPKATAIKNYGEHVVSNLKDDFTYHRKQATIKAIPLTEDVMKKLGVEGDILNIKVSWSPEPMVAHVGDFLTDGGYSVSAHDMKNTYEKVETYIVLRIKDIRDSSTATITTENKIKP